VAEPRFLISSRAPRDTRAAARPDPGWGVPVSVPTVWRLLGANNRELGRSAKEYADAPTARVGIAQLRRQLPLLTPAVWADERGRWLWRLDVGAVPLAVAARSYLRQRESAHNLALFLAAVPVARVPDPGRAHPGAVPCSGYGPAMPATKAV
jgi:hypothetical protein